MEERPPYTGGFWLTIGLEISAGWPKDPTALRFAGDNFWLRPGAASALPDISIECKSYGPDDTSAGLQSLRRFLSLYCWYERHIVFESTSVGSGGPNPARCGNVQARNIRPMYAPDTGLVVEMLPSVPDEDGWLALALYREALGLNSIFYRVLGFAKIINIKYSSGADQKAYINGALPFLAGHFALQRLTVLKSQSVDVGDYIYTSCRCAVAHANTQPIANPDQGQDIQRLTEDVDLIRAIAEHFIEYELGIKSHSTILRQHKYQVDGFSDRLGSSLLGCLERGVVVPSSALQLPHIDVRVRGYPQLRAFADLIPSLESTSGQVVRYGLKSSGLSPTVDIRFGLDFAAARLDFDPLRDIAVVEPTTAESARVVLDLLELQRALLRNRIIELFVAGSLERLGRLEPYIPSNIDPGESEKKMLKMTEDLKTQFGL